MSDPHIINYGRYMERAMRSVMADVLGQVAEHGLGGGHHFYITFETQHPGVDMPGYLKARYPREMMVVLQEWFDDLAVMGDRFRVTLNFADQPETLVIPFDAVKTFIDPSVKFGLKFDDQDEVEDGEETAVFPGSAAVDDSTGDNTGDNTGDDEDGPEDDGPDGRPKGPPETGSAEIVSIDRFRKS